MKWIIGIIMPTTHVAETDKVVDNSTKPLHCASEGIGSGQAHSSKNLKSSPLLLERKVAGRESRRTKMRQTYFHS